HAAAPAATPTPTPPSTIRTVRPGRATAIPPWPRGGVAPADAPHAGEAAHRLHIAAAPVHTHDALRDAAQDFVADHAGGGGDLVDGDLGVALAAENHDVLTHL